MADIDEAIENFIASLKDTDIYREYVSALEELNKAPDLKRRVDDFRRRNYNFQQSDEIDLNEYDQFRSEFVGFRASDQRVDAFLDAELALCRMIQDVSYRITEALDFE